MKPDYVTAVFDCDKTLLNDSNSVTPQTRETLIKLYEEGTKIILASGRSYKGIEKVLKQLEKIKCDYYICHNGSLIIYKKENVLADYYLEYTEALKMAEKYEKYAENWYFFASDGIYQNSFSREALIEAEKNDISVFSLEKAYDKKIYKIVFRLKQDKLNFIDETDGYNIHLSEPGIMEIVHKNASKGSALKYIAEKTDSDPNRIICFGDSDNDLSMFQYAGISVAMGNATDSLKKCATYITSSNNSDGIAVFFKKL